MKCSSETFHILYLYENHIFLFQFQSMRLNIFTWMVYGPAHMQLSKDFWETKSELELHKFLKVNWNLCSLLFSQNTYTQLHMNRPLVYVFILGKK